jgi:5'(3')-deoxyribonucleotidase
MASFRRFVLAVDLDGVLGDFYGDLRPIAEEWLGVEPGSLPADVTYGLPEWHLEKAGGYEELHRFAVTQRDLFGSLRPMPGGAAVLRRLSTENVRIRILTHRLFIKYFHQEAVRQTVEWLDRHGIPYWDLCFMRDKAAVGADLYIEDAPHNVIALRSAGHQTIAFGNTTNRHISEPRANDWTAVEILVRRFLEDSAQDRMAATNAQEIREAPDLSGR